MVGAGTTIGQTIAPDLAALATPCDTLELLPGNPNAGDVEAVARSLARFGQRKPITARRSDRVVTAGNTTLLAARQLGWPTVAVVWTDDDAATSEAWALADNRTGQLGTTLEPELAAMMARVRDADEALFAATSWDEGDLAELLARVAPVVEPVALSDPDDAPEAPAIPVTARGDVWALGPHRLVCGDCTDPAVVDVALEGERVGLLLTDPPYGVGIGEKNRALESVGKGNSDAGSLDGDETVADVERLWRSAFPTLAAAIEPGCPYYVFGPQGGDLGLLWLQLLRDGGLAARHILIWVKHRASFSLGRLDYEYQHEPIVYGWKQGAAHPWYAADSRTSLLAADRPSSSRLHPTMKPVALLAELISNSTCSGEIVLDPFAGSGSTLIAAHQEGRVARLVEISERYCDVVCARYQRHTGTVPILERTGVEHDFVGVDDGG